MAELLTPGVYCREVQPKSRPLEAVGTRVAGFVGHGDPSKHVGVARPVRDWQDFCRNYYPDGAKATNLMYAVYAFFANGGGRCYISNLGKGGSVAGDPRKGGGVQAFDTYDEISMIAAPGFTDPASYRALVDHAEKHQDRVAILDCATDITNVAQLTEPATVAPKSSKSDADGAKSSANDKAKGPPKSSFAAAYYPNVRMASFDGDGTVSVPPSGHMAGLYANNDARRGVHCAPANMSMATVIGVETRLTHDQQGLLNQNGINGIRHFRDRGIKVWGARTLSDDPQWRYINVRRLFAMLRESIIDGCQWAVFMPNNETSRRAIAFSCRAFLKQQWMNGALVGKTEEQAFFVHCDESNNPPELAEAGVVNVEIGICPVRPAEFIVFHLGLNAGDTADAEA